jgi:hypothetical protein
MANGYTCPDCSRVVNWRENPTYVHICDGCGSTAPRSEMLYGEDGGRLPLGWYSMLAAKPGLDPLMDYCSWDCMMTNGRAKA